MRSRGYRRHQKPPPPCRRSLLPPDEAVSRRTVAAGVSYGRFPPQNRNPLQQSTPKSTLYSRSGPPFCSAARPGLPAGRRSSVVLRLGPPTTPLTCGSSAALLRHVDLGPHARPPGHPPASRCCATPRACCGAYLLRMGLSGLSAVDGLIWLARMGLSAAELAPVLGPIAGRRRRSIQVRRCSLCPAAFGRCPSMGRWMLASGSDFSDWWPLASCVGLLVLGEKGGAGPLIWGDVFFCPNCLRARHNFAPGRSAIRCCAARELFYI